MTPIGMPNVSKLLTSVGTLAQVWHEYFGGIETLSKRVATKVDPLSGGASTAETIDKVNEVIAALKAAGLMDKE